MIIGGITGRKIVDREFIVGIAVCVGLAGVFMNFPNEVLQAIGLLLALAANAMYIALAFVARKALQHYCVTEFHVDLSMNAFYVVIASVFYVNYCIRYLKQLHWRQRMLREGAAQREVSVDTKR